MRVGRPKNKIYESLDDWLDDIIFKLFSPDINEAGNLVFKRSGDTLTLDEMRVVSWFIEGKKTAKPITKVGQEHREWKVLKNVKVALNKYGFSDKDLKDLMYSFGNPKRSNANAACPMDDSVDDE